jgi:hypothetical protein
MSKKIIQFEEPKMPVLGFGGGEEALQESVQYTIFKLAEKLKEISSKNYDMSERDILKIENMRHYLINDLPVKHLR